MPEAFFDAMVMRLFPGRTLEELDQVDWPRLMRALEVRQIETVEMLRQLHFEGKAPPMDAAQWRQIAAHDRLMERFENG
jgi:hypothetical protein